MAAVRSSSVCGDMNPATNSPSARQIGSGVAGWLAGSRGGSEEFCQANATQIRAPNMMTTTMLRTVFPRVGRRRAPVSEGFLALRLRKVSPIREVGATLWVPCRSYLRPTAPICDRRRYVVLGGRYGLVGPIRCCQCGWCTLWKSYGRGGVIPKFGGYCPPTDGLTLSCGYVDYFNTNSTCGGRTDRRVWCCIGRIGRCVHPGGSDRLYCRIGEAQSHRCRRSGTCHRCPQEATTCRRS